MNRFCFLVILSVFLALPGFSAKETVINGGGGGGLASTDIDTLAELNAILTDATLQDETVDVSSPVNDWNFETDLTTDDGSEGVTITWTNSPTLRSSGCFEGSQCVELNGTTQHGAANITFPTSGDFTFAMAGYLDAVGGADYLFAGHDGSSSVAELALFIDNEGDYSVFANAVTTERLSQLRQEAFAGWNHYAITRKDGVATVYFNGLAVASFVMDVTFDFSTCDLLIGTEADSGCAGSLGNYWDGRIDSIKRWNRALNAVSVKDLYDNP